MDKVSLDWLRNERLYYSRQSTWHEYKRNYANAVDELLAYREGYDPAERMPEPMQQVIIRWRGDNDVVCYGVYARELVDGEYEWVSRPDALYYVPAEIVERWYPLGAADG